MVKDREALCDTVHGVAKSWTWLSNWTTRGNSEISIYAEEKEGLRCKKERGAKILLNMWIDANKIARRNINNLRYADDTTLMAESEELKSILMKVKEESENVGLKHNIQKTKIMASGPITLWQIDG